MLHPKVVALGATAALAAGTGWIASSSTAASAPRVASRPAAAIDPADFVRRVDNPWFPLRPGGRCATAGRRTAPRATSSRSRAGRGRSGGATTVVHDRVLRRARHGRHARLLRAGPARDRLVLRRGHGELDRHGRVTAATGPGARACNGARAGHLHARPAAGSASRSARSSSRATRRTTSGSSACTDREGPRGRLAPRPEDPRVDAARARRARPQALRRGIGTVLEQTVKGGGAGRSHR